MYSESIKTLKSINQNENKNEEVRILILRNIAANNQALNVTFTCNAKREQCKLIFLDKEFVSEFPVKLYFFFKILVRPFSNKRFNSKFSPSLQHPLRTMSMNRLNQL